jgi:hypothetical protein
LDAVVADGRTTVHGPRFFILSWSQGGDGLLTSSMGEEGLTGLSWRVGVNDKRPASTTPSHPLYIISNVQTQQITNEENNIYTPCFTLRTHQLSIQLPTSFNFIISLEILIF